MFEGSSLTGLEIGRELSYFKARASSKQGSVLRGKATNEYTFDAGDSRVFLYTTGAPERPWVITRQRGKDPETYLYEAYDDLPFDSRRFTKPEGVRIEDAKLDTS